MRKNGEGSVRQLSNGKWECIIQSKYTNPDSNSLSPKAKDLEIMKTNIK